MRSPAPATGVNFAVLAVVADWDFCFAGRGGAGFTSSGASTAVVLRRQPGEMHPSVTTCGGAGQAQPAKVMDSAPTKSVRRRRPSVPQQRNAWTRPTHRV